MENRAKTPALAKSILSSFLFYKPRKRDIEFTLVSFRDVLNDNENANFIDRNTPVFCWGMYRLCGVIDAVNNKKHNREFVIEEVLSCEDQKDEAWPDLFLDAAKRFDRSSWGLEESHYEMLLFTLEFIRDNRKRRF